LVGPVASKTLARRLVDTRNESARVLDLDFGEGVQASPAVQIESTSWMRPTSHPKPKPCQGESSTSTCDIIHAQPCVSRVARQQQFARRSRRSRGQATEVLLLPRPAVCPVRSSKIVLCVVAVVKVQDELRQFGEARTCHHTTSNFQLPAVYNATRILHSQQTELHSNMMMIPSHPRPSSGVALACFLALSAANNPSLVSAFVPSHRVGASSSFVHRTTAATAPPAFSQNSAYAPATSSSTVLHMNLFDRFTRVVNSNLNNVLKNLEDPEKIMTQALEDMQVRCRRCLASL
jgi:hypothetical protein